MSRKTIVGVSLLIIIALVYGYKYYISTKEDTYEPSPECEVAYNALKKEAKSYDIEETIRIMNSIDLVQSQSSDMASFLEYMAKQDYSRVAPDVLEQKRKLFPIMERLTALQREHAELNDIWKLMGVSTVNGVSAFAESVDPKSVSMSLVAGDPVGVIKMMTDGATSLTSNVYDEYLKQKEVKKALQKEIDEIREQYIAYLEDYSPIYYKYMKEWDALCLKKDKVYIDLYGGRPVYAYNLTQEILQESPANREAMLLSALSLVNIAANYNACPDSMDREQILSSMYNIEMNPQKPSINEFLVEAESKLDSYIEQYPGKSAPALLLKGLVYYNQGETGKALSFFDQAAIEYPKQAEELTDLLNAYKSRSYLNKSQEGKYLIRLYQSTMEGFGMFSPNLLKAKHYASIGEDEKCRDEIFNHFYRRGNQSVQDCLLTDMQYCENNMYSSFKQILIEQSFIDVSIEPTQNWALMSKDDEIKVTINNRSDIDLENVRIFLCIHYTDMYKDEYDVQKLPSINILKHGEVTEIGVLPLTCDGKKYNDITHFRAIAMTDDKICWIDNADYKYEKNIDRSIKKQNANLTLERNQFLEDFKIDENILKEKIMKAIQVYGSSVEKGAWNSVKNIFSEKKIRIKLPRILAVIDPVFSLKQDESGSPSLKPTNSYLSGNNIFVDFDYQPKENESVPLYIYSKFFNFKVDIEFTTKGASIKSISLN